MFDLGPRESDKVARTTKELEQYLRATYSDSFQPSIMNETTAIPLYPEMPNTTYLGTELPKTDAQMTYLDKKNIDEAIHQNMRKKDVYQSYMHKIYNLVVGKTNEQLREKAVSDATFQEVKTEWYPIGYLMILKSLWFSNRYKQHPIRLLCLDTRCLYNTMQCANKNTTDYLVKFRNAYKFNEDCNGILITRGVQEHGMKILLPLHNNGFDSLQEDEKNKSEKAGE